MRSKKSKKQSSHNLSKSKSKKNKHQVKIQSKDAHCIENKYTLITLNINKPTMNLISLFNFNNESISLLTMFFGTLHTYHYDILDRLDIFLYILFLFISKISLYFNYQSCLTLYLWQTLPLGSVLGC